MLEGMMSLRALIQLAKIYQTLGSKAQETLNLFRLHAALSTLELRTGEGREGAEDLERWLQTAAMEGVEEAGELAREVRTLLYPQVKNRAARRNFRDRFRTFAGQASACSAYGFFTRSNRDLTFANPIDRP